jgi:ornithine cyclodeaminase/alanine dehydrogenase-like protein (mu-crystallin family)
LNPPPVGSYELQGVAGDRVIELGELFAGTKAGRMNEADITVYKSTGHAAEDAAISRLVYDRARIENLGVELEL